MPLDQSKRRGSEYRDSPLRGWGQANRAPQDRSPAPRLSVPAKHRTWAPTEFFLSRPRALRAAVRNQPSTPSTPRANGAAGLARKGLVPVEEELRRGCCPVPPHRLWLTLPAAPNPYPF